MTSSVSARAIIAAALAVGLPAGAAHADNECGTGPTVVCSSGPYNSGITYSGVANLDLTVNNNSDVTDGVTITPSASGGGTINVTIDNGSGTITSPPGVFPLSTYNTGVNVDLTGTTYSGKVKVNLDGGTLKSNSSTTVATGGVYIGSRGGTDSADYEFDMSGGTIDIAGFQSAGAFLFKQGAGTSTINMTGGTITGNASIDASKQKGLWANSFQNAATVTVSGGSITMNAENSNALTAWASGSGDAHISLSNATISTTGNAALLGDNGEYGTGAAVATMSEGGTGNASITMLSGSVTTSGDNAQGLISTALPPLTGVGVNQAIVNLKGGTVTTTGASAVGVLAYGQTSAQATADIDGGTITTEGDGSHGVMSESTGSGTGDPYIDMSGGTVITKGKNAAGLYSYILNGQSGADAKINMQGGSVTTGDSGDPTKGTGSHGLYATTNGSGQAYILVNENSAPVTINTYGANAHGIFASPSKGSAATAILQGGTVATAGDGSYGMAAVSNPGDVEADYYGGTLTTLGEGAHGVYASTGGAGKASIAYQSGNLTVSGKGAYGLYAEALGNGTASVIKASGGPAAKINVSGSDAFGVSAYSQGNTTTITLDDTTIKATGNAKAAVGFAERASAGQAATQATVTFGSRLIIDASGAAGQHAFYNADDQAGTNMTLTTAGTVTGSANMGGGNSTFTLAGGSWTGNIYGDFDPSETPAANQGVDNFIWSGGTLNSGFYGQGGNDTATIYVPGSANFAAAILDGGEDGGAPESRISSDIDQVTFAANNDSVAGRNITNWEKFTVNENVAIKFVDDGMTLDGYDGGNANGMGDLYMLAGSSVTGGAGNGQVFTLSGNLSNKGLLTMQDGAYGGNFVVEGDYTSDGGRLGLDVDFGDLKADVLTVGKDLGGVTQLEISEIGSTANPGAILIVDTTTATSIDQNEFKLDKAQMTASGIYAYGLVYSLEGDPGNGYPPGVYLSATGAPGPTPPGPTPPGPTPRLQPFVPLYEGYQSALLDMNTLPTMRQRVGKRAWLGNEVFAPPPAPVLTPKDPGYYSQPRASVDGSGNPEVGQSGIQTTFQQSAPGLENLWGRISGDFSHLDPTSSTTGYKYDLSTFEMQAGVDGLFYNDGPGALVGGLTVHYRTGEAKFDSVYGDSKVHPDGYGFGGTLTWYGDNGFYTDGQAQATWYSSELKADDLYKGVENSDAFGYAVSVEAGQQFLLDSNDLILTPQGQLAWSSVDIDSFTGAYNDDATFDNGDSLKARLGLAVEKEFISTDANGLARRGNVYGIANIYHEFMGETKAVIEQSFVASSELDPWTGEIGFGGTYDWTDTNNVNYGVYGEVTAATGLGSGSYSYGGNLGFRVKW